jgi:PIN domain nuclease of toxin-antitoxin system
MRLLLDTHVIVWGTIEPGRVSAAIINALENTSNELWYSPISAWEVLLLAEKGRLAGLGGNPRRLVEELFAGLTEAPLNTHVAIASRMIDLPHEDPADRFIAATAQVYDLTLVTEDRKLMAAPGISLFR